MRSRTSSWSTMTTNPEPLTLRSSATPWSCAVGDACLEEACLAVMGAWLPSWAFGVVFEVAPSTRKVMQRSMGGPGQSDCWIWRGAAEGTRLCFCKFQTTQSTCNLNPYVQQCSQTEDGMATACYGPKQLSMTAKWHESTWKTQCMCLPLCAAPDP